MKWISKGKKKTFGFKRFGNSFVYAINGIISALKTEQNLLFDLIIAALTILIGFFLKLSTIEFIIVIFAIGLVITVELINASIEYVVDMAMPEIHPLAKISKDIAAAAALVSSITALVIGLIIYVPKIIALLR